VPIRAGQPFDDLNRMKLPAAGVYPVTIELRTVEGPIATTQTHVVRLPGIDGDDAPVQPPVQQLAIVLPISEGGLTVDAAIDLLGRHEDTPLTVLLDPATLDRLRVEDNLRDGLVAALAGRPVSPLSEPDLDPSALAEINQVELFVELTSATTESVSAIGLTPADGLHLLDARPTADGLAALQAIGVTSVLSTGGRWTEGTFRAQGDTVRMVTADTDLSGLLNEDGGAHRATRLLTRLTLRNQDSADAGNQNGPVPVVLAPETPDVATVDALLRAMATGPTEAVLVTDIWQVGGDRRSGWLRPAERPTQDLRPVADVLWRVQQKLATYTSFDANADGVTGGNGRVEAIRRGIIAALSTANSPEQRMETLELLEATLNAGLSVINLHDGQPVTLAARSAPIPLVVESSADGPRKVLLQLRSDKVRSSDDSRIVEIPPGTTSIDVELEARSLGVSPLEVSMWTPDGTTMLASTRFEVRSTAIPGLGLALTGGAVLLLATWWVLDARSRRREFNEVAPAAVPAEDGER